MDAARTLATLRGAGAALSIEAGRLIVDAPAGLFTDELRAAIRQHKAELLALLGKEPLHGPAPTAPSPAPAPAAVAPRRDGRYPCLSHEGGYPHGFRHQVRLADGSWQCLACPTPELVAALAERAGWPSLRIGAATLLSERAWTYWVGRANPAELREAAARLTQRQRTIAPLLEDNIE